MGEVERPRLYRTLRSFFGAADEDSDGFVVVAALEHVVTERDVDIEPASAFGLELAGLEPDDDVARCRTIGPRRAGASCKRSPTAIEKDFELIPVAVARGTDNPALQGRGPQS